MIVRTIYTYGVSILTAPHVGAYIRLVGEAVRQDNRFALCQAVRRLQTILVIWQSSQSQGRVEAVPC
jgi:hypothetical protein